MSTTRDVGTQGESPAELQQPAEGQAVEAESGGGGHAGAGLPIVGAILGLCVGGPVGIIAGAKLGGVAAIGGSIIGYTGASIIREQREMRRLLSSQHSANRSQTRSQSLPTVSSTKTGEQEGQERKVRRRPPRRRKQVKVVESTEEEDNVDSVPRHLAYPPHLHRSQWRRMTEMNHPDSFVALINNVVSTS